MIFIRLVCYAEFSQVEQLGITLILNKCVMSYKLANLFHCPFDLLHSTYHLGLKPGTEILDQAGGAHKFQNWKHNLLTDRSASSSSSDLCNNIHEATSGGFQLVSLAKFSVMSEEGVKMQSPYDPSQIITLSPEESMRIQHSIGADIMMQLDDVIVTTSPDRPRMEEAMWRSVRCALRSITRFDDILLKRSRQGLTDV